MSNDWFIDITPQNNTNNRVQTRGGIDTIQF